MLYYSNFIFLYLHLLLVQSGDEYFRSVNYGERTYNAAPVPKRRCPFVGKGRAFCHDGGKSPFSVPEGMMPLFIIIFLLGLCYGLIRSCYEHRNNITIQSNHMASSPGTLSRRLETTHQHIENFNLQTTSGNTSLRNATEGLLPAYHSPSISRAITTSVDGPSLNASPAYDDVIQHSAITMEQEASSLPTYNDYISGTYRREETTQSQK